MLISKIDKKDIERLELTFSPSIDGVMLMVVSYNLGYIGLYDCDVDERAFLLSNYRFRNSNENQDDAT